MWWSGERLAELFAEQDLQLSSRVDPATATKLGKIVGARWIVTGTVAEFQDRITLDVRRIDVKTGKVLAAASAEAEVALEPMRKALNAALRRIRP